MELKFDNNGRFRIMQIADTQDTNKTAPATVALIKEALKRSKPDLVVFTGDQIKGYGVNFFFGDRYEKFRTAVDNLLKPVCEAGVPFTFVFGNHDDQGFGLTKKEQLEIYSAYPGCLAYNADDSLEGCCNHNLPVYGKDGRVRFNIYLLDSLSMSVDGKCASVTEGQLDWYRKTRDLLSRDNGGFVPSMLFQHIPFPEMYELLIRVPKGTPNSARGYRQYEGAFMGLNPERVIIDSRSFIGETPSVPEKNSGEFDAMLEKGDVFASFFGHDHNNSFVGEYKGMKMGYTQGCGFNIYGPGRKRGVRIIDVFEENPKDFKTETITAEDIPNFNLGSKLKYGLYTYAPNSFDAVEYAVRKALPYAAAAVAVGAAIGLSKRKK